MPSRRRCARPCPPRPRTSSARTSARVASGVSCQVPSTWWSVRPDASNTDPTRERLRLAGCVQLRVHGRLDTPGAEPGQTPQTQAGETLPPLSAELAAALDERPEPLHRTLWRLLRADGRLAPLLLLAATLVATAALMLELLLFRGLFEISAQLAGPAQQVAAMAALLAFLALLVLVEWPIAREALRLGRHLETRLRLALQQAQASGPLSLGGQVERVLHQLLLSGHGTAEAVAQRVGLAALLDSLKVRAGQDRQGGAQHQRAGEGVDQLVHDDSFGMRNRGLELHEGNKVP